MLVLIAWLWRGEQCFEIPGRERCIFAGREVVRRLSAVSALFQSLKPTFL